MLWNLLKKKIKNEENVVENKMPGQALDGLKQYIPLIKHYMTKTGIHKKKSLYSKGANKLKK